MKRTLAYAVLLLLSSLLAACPGPNYNGIRQDSNGSQRQLDQQGGAK